MTATGTDDLHALFNRQVEAIHNGDLDSVLENYRDDAVLVRFDAVATGIDEIREGLREYLTLRPRTTALLNLQAVGDVILYEADMSVGGNPTRAYGSLVLRDGKIWRQVAIFAEPPAAG